MKQLKTIRIVFIFLSINVFVFTSCSNDDDNDDPITEEITCTNAIAMYIPKGIGSVLINKSVYRAQVFTTLSSVSNFNIILELNSIKTSVEDNLGTVQLDIVTATNGTPNWGSVIGSANVPINKIIDHSPNAIDGFNENVFLYNNVALTPGTEYALVLKTQVSNFSLFWKTSEFDQDGNNPYSSGNTWEYLTIEKREFQHENIDYQFRVCEKTQ